MVNAIDTGALVLLQGVPTFNVSVSYTFTGTITMTSPKIITSINDTNGNKVFGITATASAVDYINITNAATGNPATVTLTAAGSDNNINLNLVSKGTGVVQINGAAVASPQFATFNPSDPGALNNGAAFLMAGVGGTVAYTPTTTGNLIISFTFQQHNTGAQDALVFKIVYGTGSAPANGAADTGTAIISSNYAIESAAGVVNFYPPASGTLILNGLTVSTAYWFDISCEADNAGASTSLHNIVFTIIEH